MNLGLQCNPNWAKFKLPPGFWRRGRLHEFSLDKSYRVQHWRSRRGLPSWRLRGQMMVTTLRLSWDLTAVDPWWHPSQELSILDKVRGVPLSQGVHYASIIDSIVCNDVCLPTAGRILWENTHFTQLIQMNIVLILSELWTTLGLLLPLISVHSCWSKSAFRIKSFKFFSK